MAPRYKLKLKQLDFISLVDDPAQPNAKCLLIKRRLHRRKGVEQPTALELEGVAQLVKTSDELGLAFFWAFTSTNADGSDHFDLHGDAVQADNDMIKAAAAFMERGGAVDEMHDSDPDGGRVVFAMPMTPEIAKAFGVTTKTSGLMIAIKPSPEALAKLKAGEYRAVSIAGLGEREQVAKSGRVVKSSLYTTEVDGHQHKICVCDDGSMYCEYATSAGADYGHSHGVVFEAGKLTILADSGHSHDLADGQPGLVIVAEGTTVIEASASPTTKQGSREAPRANSTQGAALPHGGRMNVAKLLAAVLAMTSTQRAYAETLPPDELEGYFGKSAAERETIAKAAHDSDPVVFKGELTGVEVRKSQGEFALKLAMSTEAAEKRAQDAEKAAAVEKSAREMTELAKRAKETLSHLAGSAVVHCAILKAVESIADEKLRGEAIQALKGANAVATGQTRAPGVNPGDAPTTPVTKRDAYTALAKGLDAFVVENKLDPAKAWLDGLDAYIKTEAGRALYDAYQAAK